MTSHPKPQEIAEPSRPTRKLTLLLKFVFVAGLLYFLASKGFVSLDATRKALVQYEKIIPAILGIVITTLLGVIRWYWLLQAQNIQLSLRRTFQLTLIGNFFNLALPGAVSGDFVKAFYIGKELKGQRARAFGSILFDRVAGLSALVLVSAGALLLRFQEYQDSSLLRAIHVMVELTAVSVIAFYGYLFLVKEHHDPLLKLFKTTEKSISWLGSVTRIYEGIRHYHHHRWTVTKVLFISIVIHLTVGWCCYLFTQALGESAVPLASLYIVVPLGLLITAVPIAPAGIGTGNVAFLYFFHLLGSTRGADVYSLYALFTILIGSIGGIVYFRFRTHEHLPQPQP